MEKRKISKNNFNFLTQELKVYKEKNVIDENQSKDILDLYQLEEMNFVKLILLVGSILVGLGVLSFIASNWQAISRPVKFFIIIFGMLLSYYLGCLFEKNYFKTGRSLMYISIFIFGSGIFLVDQMFNLNTYISNSLLLWIIGITPMALVLKDKFIFTFINTLAIIYINIHFRYYDNFIIPIILTITLYYLNKYFDYSKAITFLNNAVLTLLIINICNEFNFELLLTSLIILIVGIIMYFYDFKINSKIFKIEGSFIIGISGIILTYKNTWIELNNIINPQYISVIFTILFIVFLLYLTNKGNLISFVFIFVTILRFYFDTFYDFMPKSIFFFLGGTILLLFGYYLEKLRKIKGELLSED